MYKIEFAPLQGYTDAIYRTIHNKVFGGINCYYSPFIRLEKGEVRQKDIKDILPENNENINLVPQIIVNSNEEFLKLTESVSNLGYKRIDINMGCPFPLQTKKGRGAAILQNTKHLEDIVETSQDSIADSLKVKQDAMESGRIELQKISQPQLQFSMTMANIYALPEFEPIIDQFQLGKVIKVGLRRDYIKQSRLLQVDLNFDDFSDFECEFGELTSLRTQSDIHADLLSQAISAGKSVATNSSYWTKGSAQVSTIQQNITKIGYYA